MTASTSAPDTTGNTSHVNAAAAAQTARRAAPAPAPSMRRHPRTALLAVQNMLGAAATSRTRRGMALASAGKVTGIEVAADAVLAIVHGSRPYRVTLELVERKLHDDRSWLDTTGRAATLAARMPTMAGECTCPDAVKVCKHQIAVAGALFDELSSWPELTRLLLPSAPTPQLGAFHLEGAAEATPDTAFATFAPTDTASVDASAFFTTAVTPPAAAGPSAVREQPPERPHVSVPRTSAGRTAVAAEFPSDDAIVEAVGQLADASTRRVAEQLQIGTADRSLAALRDTLARLVYQGRLVRHGRTKGTRFAVPR